MNRSGEPGTEEELVHMFEAGRVLEVEEVQPDEDA
jgi:hypothetical protein